MFRSMLSSLVVFGVCVGFAAAEKEKTAKKATEAKIVKLDAKNATVTVTMKEVEKTFKLAEGIEYTDSTGKVVTIELFTSGDVVLVVEADGKITKMKKKEKAEPTKKPEGK
jgi:hypothetical protein